MDKLGVSEGIAIAVATASLYAFCYFFEAGYLSYYGIPASFVSLNIASIVPAIHNSILYIGVIFLWFSLCKNGLKSKIYSVATFSAIYFIGWIIAAIYYLDRGIEFVLFSYISIALLAATQKILKITEKRIRKFKVYSYRIYRTVFRTDNSEEESKPQDNLFENFVFVILAIAAPMFLAHSSGINKALLERNHNLIEHIEYGDVLIVKIYNQTVLMSPIDLASKTLKGGYYTSTLQNISGNHITPINTKVLNHDQQKN